MKEFTHGKKTVQVDTEGNIFYKGKKLCYTDNTRGYLTTVIFYKRFYVHRIVLMAHQPPPFEGMDVNHKNGNKYDNRLCNLEWVTRSENIKHSFRVLKRKHPKSQLGKSGCLHHNSKSINQIDLITGEILRTFGSIREAERETGILHSAISSALHGRCGAKQSGGFKWAFNNINK